jgi:hypothetical protein
MRTKIMKGTAAVLTADKESDSAMVKDHGLEANHDSGGGRGPHTAAAARDLPPAIVTHCAEQVFCFGGDGHTGATRPSTAWRRRVYRRNRDGAPDRILAAITLDIDDITTA